MKNAKLIFHYISYLQYPLLLVAVFYCYQPFFRELNIFWVSMNKALVFLGLGVSFSTLQDTTKTQNKLSKWVYQNPKYAKVFLLVITLQILFFIGFGLFGFMASQNENIQEVAFGSIVLGIGMISMLKAATEMADHHKPKE